MCSYDQVSVEQVSLKNWRLNFVTITVPAAASFANLLVFAGIPILTELRLFDTFASANVVAGLYLAVVASASSNVVIFSQKHDDHEMIQAFNMISVVLLIALSVWGLWERSLSVLMLLAAYFLSQYIIMSVQCARYEKEAIRPILALIIQPYCLLIFVFGLASFAVPFSWEIGYLFSATIALTWTIFALRNFNKVFSFSWLSTFASLKKLLSVMIAGSFMPLFIHLDIVAANNSIYLSSVTIMTKIIYSVPLSLSSLLIMRFAKSPRTLFRVESFVLVGIIMLSTVFFSLLYNVFIFTVIPIGLFESVVYLIAFVIFNLLLSAQVVINPMTVLKKFMIVLLLMYYCVSMSFFDIESYFIFKLLVMFLMSMILIKHHWRQHVESR